MILHCAADAYTGIQPKMVGRYEDAQTIYLLYEA